MLIAILSDIHANDLALEACLAEAEALGAEQYVFLGDLVGYGPEPEGVVQRIAGLTAAGAITVKGNHDAAVAVADPWMNPVAAAAIDWTRGRLSERSKEFLAALPMVARLGDLLFVHAETSAPGDWHYVTGIRSAGRSLKATEARVTFCGHVHVPQVYCLGPRSNVANLSPMVEAGLTLVEERRWRVVVGAVGQPRDGDPRAGFATYDTETRVMRGRRVMYDAEVVADRVRAEGLPGVLSNRLLIGRRAVVKRDFSLCCMSLPSLLRSKIFRECPWSPTNAFGRSLRGGLRSTVKVKFLCLCENSNNEEYDGGILCESS